MENTRKLPRGNQAGLKIINLRAVSDTSRSQDPRGSVLVEENNANSWCLRQKPGL